MSLPSDWPTATAPTSGAVQQRLRFATDLDNLQPTSEAVNIAKGDRDPATWRPDAAEQCDYARRYIQVKAEYRLSVDIAERQALDEMLNQCPR